MGEYINQKHFMTSGQNASQYSSSDLSYRLGNWVHWQNCRDGAEINIKAGLEINKIGR